MPETQRTLEIFERLISYDTTSANTNLPLINYVADRLEGTGARISFTNNSDETKSNLVATIGPEDTPDGIILSGHTDTVPVEGQNWSTNPYKLTEDEHAYYARGSVDMKAFDALALSRLIELAPGASSLKRPVSVVLTYDEEIGCFGVQDLVQKHPELLGHPELVIVGEPTLLRPVIAHKGIHCFEITVKGKGGHSSDPKNGVSAIKYGARAMNILDELSKEFEQSSKRDNRFTPPFSTLNVATVHGGSAINIIPDEVTFTFETRPIPGETRDELLDRLQSFFEEASFQKGNAFSFDIKEYVANPPFEGNLESKGTRSLLSVLENPLPLAVPFMTEASAYQNAGFNTVVCGPGSIDQAHQPDEFITKSELNRGAVFLERLTRQCFSCAHT